MKLSASDRNSQISRTLEELLKTGSRTKARIPKILEGEVESLFHTHIWGHREITLTILMAMLIDKSYRASRDLYACNPRSIYEKPIRSFLRKHDIPHKKSGPLNVAKNIRRINADWAANKRGDEIAMNVVRIVKVLEKMSSREQEAFATAYIVRYAEEAKRVKKMSYAPVLNGDAITLAELCRDLIANVPDGGATPQLIAGLLIEASNTDRKATSLVKGHRDSVSTTNTTSKKAGDIVEERGGGYIVYEITVKKFDEDRLRESYEAIKADPRMNTVKEVIVICRPEDVHPEATRIADHFADAVFVFEDVAYLFVNIFTWMASQLVGITPTARAGFHKELSQYVNNINTSEKVKTYFKKWHEQAT